MNIKSLLATLVLSLSLIAPGWAGPFEDGAAASLRGDHATAVRLWRPLAEQGDTSAQYNLGLAYDFGSGVPQDYVMAHKWYNLTAAQGIEGASKIRDMIARLMTPAQIAEAQRLAREWKPRWSV